MAGSMFMNPSTQGKGVAQVQAQTLLTLSAGSLQSVCGDGSDDALTLMDLPEFTMQDLELRGLNIPVSILSGCSLDDLGMLRDRADKAGCPCLILVDETPLDFGEGMEVVTERLTRLTTAANKLGCSSISVACGGNDDDDTFETVAAGLKQLMPMVDASELNILLIPCDGLTSDPTRLTDLIKRVGGFRIGTLPSFGHAEQTGDLEGTLRKLAPYAGGMHATIKDFTAKGGHKGCDLEKAVLAIRSVGYVNTLAIDFRGSGDPINAIRAARDVLEQALAIEVDS